MQTCLSTAVVTLALVGCGGNSSPASTTPDSSTTAPTLPAGIFIATAESDAAWAADMPTVDAAAGTIVLPTPRQSSFDSNGDGWYTYDELQLGVYAAAATTEWPPNYRLDPETLFVVSPGILAQNPEFEVGMDVGMVQIAYVCAWSLTWFDAYAIGDATTMADSDARIRAMARLLYVHDQSGVVATDRRLDQASLGDVAEFRQWVDTVWCVHPGWLPTPTAATGG